MKTLIFIFQIFVSTSTKTIQLYWKDTIRLVNLWAVLLVSEALTKRIGTITKSRSNHSHAA